MPSLEEVLHVTDDGKVGIGTTSPSAAIHVNYILTSLALA